jgi:4-aminobutyrate aminotransferase
MANAAEVGAYLLNQIKAMAARYPVVGEVRGKGLMIGIEFVKDRHSKEPAKKFTNDVIHEAFRNGLLLLSCGVSTIRFMPPLMVSRELAEEGLLILERSIQNILEQ